MSAEQQHKLDSLYAIDNVLTIKITMPQGDWDAVRTDLWTQGQKSWGWVVSDARPRSDGARRLIALARRVHQSVSSCKRLRPFAVNS